MVPSDAVGICIQACNADSGCPLNNKCCSNGCGNVCVSPVVEPPPSKPGLCLPTRLPVIRPEDECDSQCLFDTACPGDMKCCGNINGCGSSCMPPIERISQLGGGSQTATPVIVPASTASPAVNPNPKTVSQTLPSSERKTSKRHTHFNILTPCVIIIYIQSSHVLQTPSTYLIASS